LTTKNVVEWKKCESELMITSKDSCNEVLFSGKGTPRRRRKGKGGATQALVMTPRRMIVTSAGHKRNTHRGHSGKRPHAHWGNEGKVGERGGWTRSNREEGRLELSFREFSGNVWNPWRGGCSGKEKRKRMERPKR